MEGSASASSTLLKERPRRVIGTAGVVTRQRTEVRSVAACALGRLVPLAVGRGHLAGGNQCADTRLGKARPNRPHAFTHRWRSDGVHAAVGEVVVGAGPLDGGADALGDRGLRNGDHESRRNGCQCGEAETGRRRSGFQANPLCDARLRRAVEREMWPASWCAAVIILAARGVAHAASGRLVSKRISDSRLCLRPEFNDRWQISLGASP